MNRLFSFLFVVALLMGCKSPPTTAYQVSKGASITVETALAVWDGWVAAGKATANEERQVKSAFVKYQNAQLLLLESAILYKEAQAAKNSPLEAVQLKSLNAATAAAGVALADLVALIREFGVKI